MEAEGWFGLLWDVAELLLQFACILFLPTVLIRSLKKDLGFSGAFLASWFLILLPLLTFFNNYFLTIGLQEDFGGWGISEVELFSHLAWGLTIASTVASFYAGLLFIWTRGLSARRDVLLFLWGSFFLNAIAQVALPMAFFGEYGLWIAKSDIVFLSVYGVVAAAASLLLTSAALGRRLYSESDPSIRS